MKACGGAHHVGHFCVEYGHEPRQTSPIYVRPYVKVHKTDDQGLMPGLVQMLSEMAAELAEANDRIADLEAQILSHARRETDMQRLMEITGVGPTFAAALVAAIGDGSCFNKARDLSAWLGLKPRRVTTGGKARLIGILKHGNSYLRKLFIHGARAVLHLVDDRSTPLAGWVDALKERAHADVASVAMANKLARIAWAVLTKGERYRACTLEAEWVPLRKSETRVRGDGPTT